MPVVDLCSEVTGTVWRVVATEGQSLAEDEPVVIVESMKMEVPVCAPEDCRLLSVSVSATDMVREGDVVARLEVD